MDYVAFGNPRVETAYKSGKHNFSTSSTSTVGEKLPSFTQNVDFTKTNGVCVKYGCPRQHEKGECCSCDDEPCECHCCFCTCSTCDKTVQTHQLCTKECCTQTDKAVRKCCKCCRCCRRTKGICRGCVNREVIAVNMDNNVREENHDDLHGDEENDTNIERESPSYQDTNLEYCKTKMVRCKSTQCSSETAEICNSPPRSSLTRFMISLFDRRRDCSHKSYALGECGEEERGTKSPKVDEPVQKNKKNFVSSTFNFYNGLEIEPDAVTVLDRNKITDLPSETVFTPKKIEDVWKNVGAEKTTRDDFDRLKNIETKVMSKLETLEEKLNKVTVLKPNQMNYPTEESASEVMLKRNDTIRKQRSADDCKSEASNKCPSKTPRTCLKMIHPKTNARTPMCGSSSKIHCRSVYGRRVQSKPKHRGKEVDHARNRNHSQPLQLSVRNNETEEPLKDDLKWTSRQGGSESERRSVPPPNRHSNDSRELRCVL